MKDVTVLFLDETFSSTATGPMEVFRHAGILWNRFAGSPPVSHFRVTAASASGGPVRCDGPICIQPDAGLADIARTDLIFIPSTGLDIENVVERNASVVPWLKEQHAQGAAIASVCSGVGLVAAAGLLDGRRATTHWSLAERFQQKYPAVHWRPEMMVTEDGDFFCGGGLNAALDLSLYLVGRFCGHEVAVQSAKAMLIEMPRVWQAGFAITPMRLDHSDAAIAKAQEWLHSNFAKAFSLEAPASAAGMSLRTFVRRFKSATGDSPLIYLQKLRIAAAKRLLENDRCTMQEVSDAVGYQDVVFFRQVFRRHAGTPPAAYRRKFDISEPV